MKRHHHYLHGCDVLGAADASSLPRVHAVPTWWEAIAIGLGAIASGSIIIDMYFRLKRGR